MELYNKEAQLNSIDEIEEAFKSDYGYDLIEQNTTDYYTEAECTIKIKDKYYDVTVYYDMVGSWQDVGDKLYTIDEITKVTYEEISEESIVMRFNRIINVQIELAELKVIDLKKQIIAT